LNGKLKKQNFKQKEINILISHELVLKRIKFLKNRKLKSQAKYTLEYYEINFVTAITLFY